MFSSKCLPLRVASARAFVISAVLGIPSRCDAFFKLVTWDLRSIKIQQTTYDVQLHCTGLKIRHVQRMVMWLINSGGELEHLKVPLQRIGARKYQGTEVPDACFTGMVFVHLFMHVYFSLL